MAEIIPEQHKLLALVNELPKFDSSLPVKDIEDGKFKPAEKAVTDSAAQLKAEGKLEATLSQPITIGDKATTLESFIREEKRYQLTTDGNLYSTASARRDEIAELPKGAEGQGQAAQRHAFVSHEETRQREATVTFMEQLKKQDGAQALFKEGTRVFDIGYHNGDESTRVAKTLIENGVPADKIVWDGMELTTGTTNKQGKTAHTQLMEAGLKPENLGLVAGKLGFTDATMGDGKTENLANNLERLRVEDKHDVVLALNVSNFGDKDLFFRQVDAAMKPEAIALALHDAGGDALDFRKKVNEKAGRGLMRNADEPATAKVDAVFGEQNRELTRFSVPYKVTFPPVNDEMWDAMKNNVQTANFTRDYREDVKATAIDPEAYKAARLQVEFLTGQPLTTYSKDERALVLDTLKETLAEKGNALSGKFEGQVALSKEHSKDLAGAVKAAALATEAKLAIDQQPQEQQQQQAAPQASWVARKREEQSAMQQAAGGR